MAKQYIEVAAHFLPDGKMEPVMIWWGDKYYTVDKILDTRRAASLKAGGVGIRYTCRILNKDRYLFYDDEERRWFVELPDSYIAPF